MPDVSFFRKNKQYLQLEWNAASGFDWPKIRQLFVAAYVSAYKDVPLEQLDLNPQVVSYAREKNLDPLVEYFKHCFDDEFEKIKTQNNSHKYKINYLVVRFHEQPIAFVVTQLNFKSGRVYVRWNTVSPSFHRQGLGKIMLDAIAKYYKNSGLELYTRASNTTACNFYDKSGLTVASKYNFAEPDAINIQNHAKAWIKSPDYRNTIFPPIDEMVENTEKYTAFCKTKLKYRF